jgi:hypothetical protein
MHLKNIFGTVILSIFMISGLATTLQAQTSPQLYATTRQVQTLLNRIENRTDAFQAEVQRTFNSDSRTTNREDRISDLISDFENATDTLKVRVNARQTLVGEVDDVFNRAARINNFMLRNRLNTRAESQWSQIRTDLNTLARYYRISWNWNNVPNNGNWNNQPGWNSRGTLDGTYRLNVGRSDNISTVIDTSVRRASMSQRDNWRRGLERRLSSPNILVIDAEGTSVTMATSDSGRATFQANGVATTETNQRGRRVTTTATLNNNGLQVNYTGDRVNDFFVTFTPTGREQLTVTKRIYLEGRNDTVTVTSIYDRTSDVADFSAVGNGRNWTDTTSSTGDFYVPNGTRLVATLQTTVNTRASQVGDRVTMTVTSPSQYRNAVIEGRIIEAENSGRVSGRANIAIGLDTIRMNGRTYAFAGIIDSVRAANGDSISVNNEGVIRDRSQTTQTATRAGIGAVIGGIIGAIAGGGSGAAIGAGVGAGAGAGTVLIAGRDSIELGAGSTFDITASAPANRISRY